MVFLKILGVFDIVIALTLLLLHLDVSISWRIPLMLAILLMFKAFLFKESAMSIVDGVIAVYMVLPLLGLNSFITVIAIIIMAQKGIISMF